MKKCPSCGLINPNDTWVCDCGYSFLTERKQFGLIQPEVFIQPTDQEAMRVIKERLLLTSGILLHILYTFYWLYWLSLEFSWKPLINMLIGSISGSIIVIVSSLLCMPIARKINRGGGTLIQVSIALYIGMSFRLINALLYAIIPGWK